MFQNIFNLSNEGKSLDQKLEASRSFNLSNSYWSKDDLRNENIASTEQAEHKIWQGIKSEKKGDLDLAIAHYRRAIELDPECAKAYQFLSIALRKAREQRQAQVKRIDANQTRISQSLVNVDLSSEMIDVSLEETVVAEQGSINRVENLHTADITAKNSAPQTTEIEFGSLTEISSQDLTIPDFSNLDLINTKVNNFNLPEQQANSIVLLPDVDVSPSGDFVLQENLSVAQVYVQQALAYFEQKQWDKSIDACQEALRICPNLGEAYKVWGNCLQKSGNTTEAIGIYAKALEIQPDMAEIYCNLGSIYAKAKKWQQAIENYQKSTIIDPNSAAPYRNLARVWDELGEYDKSADCFFKALEIDPKLLSPQNHFDLANNLLAEEKLNRAIDCYKKCIGLEPKFLQAYIRLAEALEKNGQKEESLVYYKKLAKLQTDDTGRENHSKTRQQIRSFLNLSPQKSTQESTKKQAISLQGESTAKPTPRLQPAKNSTPKEQIKQYHQAAQQKPDSAPIQIELGNIYFRTQQWQNAISSYLKAIKLAPKVAKYYINLGKAWEKVGDLTKANQAYYQGFSLEPDKVSAKNHFLLGNKLLEQRKAKSAIACYRRAITLEPDLIDAYWKLGEILLAIGNHQGAIACYQQALKVSPNQARSYFLLGQALYQQKRWQPALACYQKASNLEPDNADIQHNLGEVLAQEQQWSEAATAYRKAIAINPDNSWSHNNLGNVLLKLKKWSEAAECFRQAIKLRPDFVWSHYNLGEALAQLEQWDEASAAYSLAQEIQPDLPEVQAKIGAVLHQRTKQSRQEALSFYAAQIAKDPDNVDLYHQAISLDKKNHQLYLGLGKALVKQGQLDEASAIYQIGLELQPRNIELAMGLSEILLAKNPELGFQDIASRIAGGAGATALLSETSLKKSYRAGTADYSLQLPCHDAPEISIIIPVYNQIDYTFKCLRSIANNINPDLAIEVIVVNDCSSDDTIPVLEQVVGLKRIDNQENLGFIHSCNKGIAAAKGEYIYFLNNDTQLRPQALEQLLSICQKDPQVGGVGSKLVYPDGSLQEAGGIIWHDASGWNYGRKENAHAPKYNYVRPVDYCSAASLLVRKSALTALNGFNRDFAPAYYEDTDLCFGIRHQLGLKVMYQPKSTVVHYEGVSCGTELTSGIKQYQSVNMTKFQHKWAEKLLNYPSNQGATGVESASRRYLGNKTILVIDIYAPCYDRESGARRLWQLLQIFKQLNYHVIFVPDNGAKEQPYMGMLQDLEIEVVYTEPGYGTAIEQQLEELLPLVDLAWICRPQLYEKYAPLIRQHSNIKLIYDTVDLHYLRLRRAGELATHSIESMRQWVRMQSRELKAAHEADLTITITSAEQSILQQQQVSNLAVVPNLHLAYSGEKPSFQQRQGLLFIGSYNHPPNIDGVKWLCQEIMPLVWEQLPELTVTLLGSNPTEEVIALGQDERVTVTGYVFDVTLHFLNHRVFVAPLRYGAGMKGKIGQSLEYGLPLISTAIGVEGMNLTHEQNVLEANKTQEFAQQIIRLYQDEQLWNKLANNSTEAIAPFTPEVVKQELNLIFNKLLAIN